jgi:hypothetical protein
MNRASAASTSARPEQAEADAELVSPFHYIGKGL